MSFTGKATYSAGASLPEVAEDVSDLIAINSPHETPLLDALGDASRPARSTVHEWLEDALLPNSDAIDTNTWGDPEGDATFPVHNTARFRVGDQVRVPGSAEIMLVSAINAGASQISVVRGYGGTVAEALTSGAALEILGNAALEGDAADAARFTARARKSNYTQIFSASVEVSGSELAVKQIGLADEMDYQKQQRLRELLRDLENSVINGVAPTANQQGSSTARRTMRGIGSFIASNRFQPGSNSFPTGANITEEQLNTALREIWARSNGQVDLIVTGGLQKRAINSFVADSRRYTADGENYKDLLSIYESDYGICRVVLCRWVPRGTVLLLDSSRIEVLPLAGRSFYYKPLAATGDAERERAWGD